MAAEKNENFVGMIVGNQVRTRYLEWVVVDVSFTLSVLTKISSSPHYYILYYQTTADGKGNRFVFYSAVLCCAVPQIHDRLRYACPISTRGQED